jgi:hypothetical protein
MENKETILTPHRKKFNEKHNGLNQSELLMELLFAQEVTQRKLERIRTDTSKLVWFLIAIPIIVGIIAAIFMN